MKSFRSLSRSLLLLFLVSAAACSDLDARTKRITVGMPRDSMIAIIQSAEGVPPTMGDSNTNIWRVAQYLKDGKMIEVIYYSGTNEHWTPADTVPEKRVVPIVIMDGKVAAVGQGDYQKTAGKFSLPRVRY